MHILVTGFDAFGGDELNPSQLVVESLPKSVGKHRITTCVIPTEALAAKRMLQGTIQEISPDAIISIGQAGGAAAISLERVGINLCEFRIPDNSGMQLKGIPVCAEGPDAYLVDLPLKAMARSINEKQIPAALSYSAGTFVCNYVLYVANWLLEQDGKRGKAGFIHVPYLPEQVIDKPHLPSMSLTDMVTAVIAALEAIDSPELDIPDGKLY